MKKIINHIFVIALLSSCNSNKQAPIEVSESTITEVKLTEEQLKAVSIETAKASLIDFSVFIEANGNLDVPPQNAVSIMALYGGYVKSTEMLQGKKVRKGEVLCVMQDPSYIQLQQEYLETKSKLDFLKAEYDRQEALSKEQINSQKILQQAKSEYQATLAKSSGLLAKLKLLNISIQQLEGGNISPEIKILSPINGFVTVMNVNIGSYVQPQDLIFRIVDTEHLHAELIVYEKDISNIAIGQEVNIMLNNEKKERLAHVYLINKEISTERTIRVHCHLDVEDPNLIPGSFFHAKIASQKTPTYALPNQAIVSFEDKNYAFVTTNNPAVFHMIEVSAGISENGFLMVTGIDTSLRYVTNGAYDLLSKMKNTAEEE
jgi:cobalt-zinc-cadmium efflux system membrane fusion protein